MLRNLLLPVLLVWGCDDGGAPVSRGGTDGTAGADAGADLRGLPAVSCDTDDDCAGEPVQRACRDHGCADPHCPTGMVYVGAGDFYQGCSKADKDCGAAAQPEHLVTLSRGFCIGTTELTVAQYRSCAGAGRCPAPAELACDPNTGSWTDKPGAREGLPLNCLLFSEARTACEYLYPRGRLPTEAEWEKAARGNDKRKYPWGSQVPKDCAKGVNWAAAGCRGAPWPAGSGKGALAQAACGAFDMAGNLWEWTADFYDDKGYQACADGCSDPTGPPSGKSRVRRGGAFTSDLRELRASYREFHTPEFARSDILGVRCAATLP